MKQFKLSRNDFWILLLSLALGIIIWADGVREADPEQSRQLSIPLTVNGRTDAVLSNELPDSIEIILQAPGTFMQDVRSDSFTAVVNLDAAPLGASEQEVRVDVVDDAFSADWITSQNPRKVLIRLDTQETKSVPVLISVRGSAGQGFTIGDKVAEPASIELTGPSSRLNNIVEARTDLFLDAPFENISRVRQVTFYDVQGEPVSLGTAPIVTANETSVRVNVSIVELPGFKTIPIRPDIIGQENENYIKGSIEAIPPVVTVNGAPELLDALVSVQTTAIDIDGLREPRLFDVDVLLPDGISRVDQTKITVNVEIEPIIAARQFTLTPELVGLNRDEFSVRLDNTSIELTLSGPQETMNALTEGEIRLSADLSGLDSGRYEIVPEVGAPIQGIEVRSVQPQVLIVELVALNPTATPPTQDSEKSPSDQSDS